MNLFSSLAKQMNIYNQTVPYDHYLVKRIFQSKAKIDKTYIYHIQEFEVPLLLG